MLSLLERICHLSSMQIFVQKRNETHRNLIIGIEKKNVASLCRKNLNKKNEKNVTSKLCNVKKKNVICNC